MYIYLRMSASDTRATPCLTYRGEPLAVYGRWNNEVEVAHLHCVNTKWVIWKHCWHVAPCHKSEVHLHIQ